MLFAITQKKDLFAIIRPGVHGADVVTTVIEIWTRDRRSLLGARLLRKKLWAGFGDESALQAQEWLTGWWDGKGYGQIRLANVPSKTAEALVIGLGWPAWGQKKHDKLYDGFDNPPAREMQE